MTIDITKPCTTRDGRPVRNLVRYTSMIGPRIGGLVMCKAGIESLTIWRDDGSQTGTTDDSKWDLIQAPEVVEVTVYYYRSIDGPVWTATTCGGKNGLIAKRVERVTVGEGL